MPKVAAACAIKPDAAAKRLQRAREALGERLVAALDEARETGDRARGRVVRVMGAVALAEVAWHASAAATVPFGASTAASREAFTAGATSATTSTSASRSSAASVHQT